jgi:prolipoprotein diacylglyceryl transferase
VPYVHNLDPIAFSIGPLAIRWYGLMYLIGFLLFLVLGKLRARDPWRDMKSQDVDDLLFYGMIGTIVGGRLGHVLFYGPLSYYLANPLDIFAVWKGGMASHGGIIGVIVAMALFARARGKSCLRVADFVVPLVPLASVRVASVTSSMVSYGAAQPMHRYRGRSCFRRPATRSRDIRRRFISSCWKA